MASSIELLNASKYFRLECDLAIRSGKPALIFLDKMYVSYFDIPSSIGTEIFDIQEIEGKGAKPSSARFRHLFRNFCDQLTAEMTVSAIRQSPFNQMHVGIVVPTDGPENRKYNSQDIGVIRDVLAFHGVASIKEFPWPAILHREYMAKAETLDFLVLDIGQAVMNSGIAGYLHGRFIPSLRITKSKISQNQLQKQKFYQSLYSGIEVGYAKDIVIWDDAEKLKSELNERMLLLNAPVMRINTKTEAENYFRKASQRKDAVFLSYSGRDHELASEISQELKKRFQQVFDYKDGESITPGEPWLREIFDKLSVATLGVPLVSSNYFESGNCEHEALDMVAMRDSGRISMIPLKLYEDDEFQRPTWMSNRQYMHSYDYPDIPTLVDKLVEFFDRSISEKGS